MNELNTKIREEVDRIEETGIMKNLSKLVYLQRAGPLQRRWRMKVK